MSELHKGPCYHDGPTCPAPTVKVSDPIRARLDDPRPATAPTKYELWAALRAVLELLPTLDIRGAEAGRIRRVIAENLGVTDEGS